MTKLNFIDVAAVIREWDDQQAPLNIKQLAALFDVEYRRMAGAVKWLVERGYVSRAGHSLRIIRVGDDAPLDALPHDIALWRRSMRTRRLESAS